MVVLIKFMGVTSGFLTPTRFQYSYKNIGYKKTAKYRRFRGGLRGFLILIDILERSKHFRVLICRKIGVLNHL